EHQMFYYLLAMLIALRLSVSLYEIPSAALAPELTPDYDERTTLLSYRFFFGMMGGGTMAVLAFQVFLRKDAAHPLGVLNRAGYGAYGLTAAVVMLITILISCFGTHGRGMVITEPRKHSDFAGRIQQIKTTFSNQSLVALMVAALIAGTAGGLGAGLSLYIATYFWELSPHEISFLVASGAIAAVLAVGLAPVVSKRMGKKRAMITVFIMAMIADVIPIPLRLVGLMPANHTRALLAALLADGIVRDTLGVMGFIIVASMVADIVEDIAVQTGKRSEGLLFAANGLLLKWVTAIGTFASGLLLEFSHFPQGATPGNVDPLILRHLVLIFVPFTACCHAMAITALTFYRIDRTTHQHNLDRLRDAAAVAELVTEKAGEDAAALPP
ncbi:MAG TPA: MFS transporter, partial [Candidatus Binataceae bacterium]|nr:MFS transporter [Candidatus Binataceae bacterium]